MGFTSLTKFMEYQITRGKADIIEKKIQLDMFTLIRHQTKQGNILPWPGKIGLSKQTFSSKNFFWCERECLLGHAIFPATSYTNKSCTLLIFYGPLIYQSLSCFFSSENIRNSPKPKISPSQRNIQGKMKQRVLP
jgi:hypothetical protein